MELLSSVTRHDVKARSTCEQVIMEYTHDEYSDTLLTFDACNIRGTDANTCCISRSTSFRFCSVSTSVTVSQWQRGETPIAILNRGRSQDVRTPDNEDDIIAALELEPW